MPAITVAEFNAIITEELTWAADIGMHARAIDDGTATLVLPFDGNMVRPGGTVSGPFMMARSTKSNERPGTGLSCTSGSPKCKQESYL